MRRNLGPALLAALLVAGCGGSDRATDTTQPDSGDAAAAEPDTAPVNPVTVTMVAAEPRPAPEILGPGGATVQRTGPDGTVYELHIPPGALAEPTEITVAPLLRLDGLPDDTELAFGVGLEPEGLVFAKPAWLYVDLPDGAAVDVRAGLAVDGEEASLRPIGYDGDRYILAVAHFSGRGGVGFPGPGGFGGWPDRGPSNPTSGGLQGGAIDLGGPVDVPAPGNGFPPNNPPGEPPGPGGDDERGGEPDRDSLADGDTPAGDDGGGDLGDDLRDALEELANAQLTGDEEGEQAAEKKLDEMRDRIRGRVDELARACIDEKDLTKLKDLLYWQTIGQLIGYDNEPGEAEYQQQVLEACNQFELDTYGEFAFDMGGGVIKMGDSITVKVPLLMAGAGYEGSQEGPVDGVGYDRGAELLELLGQGVGAFVGINVPNDYTQNDYFNCGITPGQGQIGAVATTLLADTGPTVNVSPATLAEATVSCPDPIGAFGMPPFVTDLELLREAGLPEATESGLLLENWEQPQGGSPVATKELHHQVSEQGATVDIGWHFTINHTPGKMPTRN
ncbi:MAG: hypothetical protein ACT4OX_04350 [Actinomycetota bacterium]